ncbi:MAG: AMP-binding protein, partial [Bradymonadaceae bacterium]
MVNDTARLCGDTLDEVLRDRARESPDRELFVFLDDREDETERLTYRGLLDRSRAVAEQLIGETSPGDRILLLYESSLEYIEAFFGCLLAGRVAVPVYPPDPNRLEQTLPRLLHIVDDAEPAAVATTARVRQMAEGLMADQ